MYFLVEHNRDTKHTEVGEFTDFDEAKKQFFKREQHYLQQGQDEMEVVLFESESLDTLTATHSRYFVNDYEKNNEKKGGKIGDALIATGVAFIAVGLVSLAVGILTKHLDE